MNKYEYHIETVKHNVSLETLNKLGLEGWELVCVSFSYDREGYAYFKRVIDYIPYVKNR